MGEEKHVHSTCASTHLYDDSECSGYDDSDFTASEMCCACGGGDTRICENTDNGAKNSQGYSCVDVAIEHNHGYDTCKSDFDTPTFTASSMCCACGGGQTIQPSATTSETCEHVSNSEGYTCSDIAVFRSFGYDDLCTSAYDTPAFVASEMCLV